MVDHENAPAPPPQSSLAVLFRDLCYSVPSGKAGMDVPILKGVSGAFVPGRMTAVVSIESLQASISILNPSMHHRY